MNEPIKGVMATFGAGCFWQAEAAFAQHLGILKTSVGYMGGHFANPSYLDVLARITGHAEVAQIHYEQATVRYETLLNIFWRCHDPTTLNRQGPDRGEQYRSVIGYLRPSVPASAASALCWRYTRASDDTPLAASQPSERETAKSALSISAESQNSPKEGKHS